MTDTVTELTEAELDALIERVTHAIEHELSLSIADLRLLLNALVMLTQLQDRLADHDVTLHKLRKLAGIVKKSEQLKDIVPKATTETEPKRRRRKKPPTSDNAAVVHERCHHKIEGFEKGQVCPECEKGKLYKYEPAVRLRISGQTPLIRTEHILERLRCNTCGAYFTAEVPAEVQQDGPLDQRYGYSTGEKAMAV